MIAAYGVQDKGARGRYVLESERSDEAPLPLFTGLPSSGLPPLGTRSPWQRDRDRVLHSTGFRTLQYKTQVFLNHEGDFFRTRLTHSLEVSQIARSIARSLKVNEDLTEVIALAHDLGHTPFGHAGEDALQETMAEWGGFDHNVQSLRLVTELESRYQAFNGLNLTWETLEGLAKHNGPVKKPSLWLQKFDAEYSLILGSFASVEAQIAAICDDIAYHGHDLDDGLRAGLLSFEHLDSVPLLHDCLEEARALDWAGCDHDEKNQRIRHETVRRVIHALVMDLTTQTYKNLMRLKPETADDVRHAGEVIVTFSPDIAAKNKEIRKFLYANMYRHWRVERMTRKARIAVKEIFTILGEEPKLLPPPWRNRALLYHKQGEKGKTCRVIADYIAGMTDRLAMEEHSRLMNLSVLG